MIKLEISTELLQHTLQLLKESPKKERVVLWFGKKENDTYSVKEVHLPFQITEEDSFFIPPEGMEQIMNRLRPNRLIIVAQIHTHPFEAYHSEADDTWAIVRHLNAYSLVIPWFCKDTTVSNFLLDVATYVLNNHNYWEEVSNKNLIIK
ncbi:MAG: hypothetical protein ACTHMD_09630 [Flavisolibacter sp.]